MKNLEFENENSWLKRTMSIYPVFMSIDNLDNSYIENSLLFSQSKNYSREEDSYAVETVLLQLPLPTIVIENIDNEKLKIIHNGNFVKAILRFLNNDYKLKNLEILKNLNNLDISELKKINERYLSIIRESKISVIMIGKNTPIEIKHEVLKRLEILSKK